MEDLPSAEASSFFIKQQGFTNTLNQQAPSVLVDKIKQEAAVGATGSTPPVVSRKQTRRGGLSGLQSAFSSIAKSKKEYLGESCSDSQTGIKDEKFDTTTTRLGAPPIGLGRTHEKKGDTIMGVIIFIRND